MTYSTEFPNVYLIPDTVAGTKDTTVKGGKKFIIQEETEMSKSLTIIKVQL